MTSKILILILFICLPLASIGQGWQLDSVTYNEQVYYLYPKYQKKKYFKFPSDLEWVWKKFKRGVYKTEKFPIDGRWIQFYEDDSSKVARIFTISDSLLTGEYQQFYFNQTIEESGKMNNGNREDMWYYYHDNGQVAKQGEHQIKNFGGTYFISKPIGEWKSWFPNGQQESIKYYNLESTRVKTWLEYFDNGQIKSKVKYVNGKIDSFYTEFAENGEVLVKHNFHQGELIDTLSIYYYPNGKIRKEGKFDDKIPIGPWTYYYENGKIQSEGKYIDYFTTLCISAMAKECHLSTKEGKWTYYHPNGNIRASGNYNAIDKDTSRGRIKKSKEVGEWKYYYPNGQIMAIGSYRKITEPKRLKSRRKERQRFKNWQFYDSLGNLIESKDQINIILDEIQSAKWKIDEKEASR